MIVVKIGGSLYNTPELTQCLSALVKYSTQQAIVIVPGGGPFADQVRSAQAAHHFSDDIAHHMAIMAMKQFGLVLHAKMPTSQPISTYERPKAPLSIWLPDDELLTEPSLAHSWDISSDSIALWLSNKLDAEQLLLIKSAPIHTTSIKVLSSESILDAGFIDLFSKYPATVKIINYQASDNLADSLSDPKLKLI
ncbi:MAG: delta 1-pyrroline-5-carboxylate synthetase [Gammaproteobacteria bacterium]|nr:delta 1-pyrroline-5-carboxylate synthetase [Gammaproteobacteria bacterium]